ncbi:MAG TPA: response regulator [Gemmatimonadales bacterium]|nr:response regulator [Gemmatimonadales bacterium]
MASGRILIADDEQTFLNATADLLRREGYEVDTVLDGRTALERVRAGYDLLITDLEMPGNEDLALVRGVAEAVGGLPIIIITGYPSTRSAIAAIELPVSAYLLKPVRFEDLITRVTAAVSRFRTYQAMRQAEDRLNKWRDDFQHIAAGKGTGSGPGVDAFLALTLRNVMGSLTDLELLGQALAGHDPAGQPCQLINCPRGAQLQSAVQETVDVLEATKGAFKSKALGELRKKLELLLQHV